MQLVIDSDWAMSVFLASVRLGAMLSLTPIFGMNATPARFRVLLILALSALLAMATPLPPAAKPSGLGAVLIATAGEVFVGATLAFGIFAAFAALSFAGKILDIQIGFGMASILNPATNTTSPLLASAFGMLGAAMFVAADGHHALMRGIAFSLEAVPLGSTFPHLSLAPVVKQFGCMFSMGIVLAAPVVLGLVLVEAALAVLSRSLPQMNIFFVGMPVKVLAGLGLLALCIGHIGPAITKTLGSIFIYWESLLR
jgi:flagellar biosynthesis protein FliR